jgi:hypothetical protein
MAFKRQRMGRRKVCYLQKTKLLTSIIKMLNY